MPVVALPMFWAAVAAGAGATGAIYSANKQSGAAQHAADVQQKSTADALAFQKQQAENTFQNTESTRKANYDQWAAKQQSMNATRAALGLSPVDVPAYVPGIDPSFTGTGTTPAGTPPAGATTPTGPASPAGANYQQVIDLIHSGKDPQAAIDAANTAQHLPSGSSFAWRAIPTAPGGGVVEIPGGAYLTPNPAGQWGYVPGASGASGGATAPRVGNVGSYLQPEFTTPIAPGVLAPSSPYGVQSVGAYLGG